MLTLRPYQEETLDALRKGFASGKTRQVLYAPTGAGKTEMAIALLNATRTKGNRSAMVLDRIVLCDQTSSRLQSYDIEHGVLQSNHFRYKPHELIQICSAQTLERRDGFPDLQLLIIDEAHTTRKKTMDYINANPDVKVIGLTATPFTKGMGKIYDNVISTVTTKQLVEQKVLVPLKVFIAKEIDMEGAKKVAGEWSPDEVTTRGLKITGDIVAEWINKTQDVFGGARKTIVFCAGVNHGIDLAKKFKEAGYNFISISYREDDDYKKKVLQDFSKPDTDIDGLIATDILTKGFDCIAEGSKVLTDRGLVAIEKVRYDDKVWDGHEFVSHGGVVCKGEKHVITYQGLTATPDHLVKTAQGWIAFGECQRLGIPIIRTGNDEHPVREDEGCFSGNICSQQDKRGFVKSFLQVLNLRSSNRFEVGNLDGRSKLSKMLYAKRRAKLAGIQMQKYAITLRKSVAQSISKLWGSWHPVQVQFSTGSSKVDRFESWSSESRKKHSIGSHQQQWSLRAGKFALGSQIFKLRQHTQRWMGGKNSQVQDGASRNSIRRQDVAKFVFNGNDFGSNYQEVSQKVGQTKRRVWDILNCGSRNCFTCEGLLVHNCPDVMVGVSARPFSKSLSSHIQQMGRVMRGNEGKEFALWLDHSGNYLRFRENWDDVFENGVTELDDSKEKPKKEPTQKEKEEAKCPRCHAFWAFSSDICGACGYVKERKNKVQAVAGMMEELNGAPSMASKQEFWSMMQWYVRYNGWNDKRALATYKEKFGTWPKGLSDTPLPPNADCTKYINKKIQAYLYKMGKIR